MKDQHIALSEAEKVQVLLRALDERYKAMHTVRERAQSVAIWGLGVLIVASGWIVQRESLVGVDMRAAATALVLLALYVLKEHYIKDLDKTFQDQHKVAVRIEKILGLYERGAFAEEGVYPEIWSLDSSEKRKRLFFYATYRLLYMGVFIFLAVLWLANL
ncbi:MAG: hypothetical protein HZA81_03320 [Candidatus Taylorbacteria bacterium]|nr:hypothetical protein [Candidatus Taylorbacteria bacterium]